MKASDFENFRNGLDGVYSFYGKNLSTFALDVWWSALNGYDLSAVTQAFNRHLVNPDTGQYLPKPADIMKMFSGTTQDAALVAWAKVDRSVRVIGTYADVVFDDSIIHRVIQDMGGWIQFGSKDDSEWPFVAKEFENRYRGYKIRSETPEYPPKLIGMANAHNAKGGFKIEPPRLIGEEHKCLKVLDGGTDRNLIGFSAMPDVKLKLVTN